MKAFLERHIPVFFTMIILGGVLWGLTGIGYISGRNLNVIHLLLNPYRKIEGLIYMLIGFCTAAKTLYNLIWDKPKDPPYIVFIIFTVVAFGFYWGIIGCGILFGINLNLADKLSGSGVTALGILYYTVGIFALIKLFNFIHTHKKG